MTTSLTLAVTLPKTWKFDNSQKKHQSGSTYVSRVLSKNSYTFAHQGSQRPTRRTFHVFSKRTSLAHLGEVTIVLSKKGPIASSKVIKVRVNNLPELSAKQVLMGYKRRCPIEILFREFKSSLGLGQHQVTKATDGGSRREVP